MRYIICALALFSCGCAGVHVHFTDGRSRPKEDAMYVCGQTKSAFTCMPFDTFIPLYLNDLFRSNSLIHIPKENSVDL